MSNHEIVPINIRDWREGTYYLYSQMYVVVTAFANGFFEHIKDEATYRAMCVSPDHYQPTDDAFKVWEDSFPYHKTENGQPVQPKDCTVTPYIEAYSESENALPKCYIKVSAKSQSENEALGEHSVLIPLNRRITELVANKDEIKRMLATSTPPDIE